MWSEKMPTCVGNSKTTLLEQQHFVQSDKPVSRHKEGDISQLTFQTIEKDPLYEILFL